MVNIDFEIVLVSKAEPTKELATIVVNKSAGYQAMGYDFDAGTRFGESYARCGKVLGKLLVDKAL